MSSPQKAALATVKSIQDTMTLVATRKAAKLLWLALRNVMSKSTRSTREWKIAMNQFAILYGDRFTGSRS